MNFYTFLIFYLILIKVFVKIFFIHHRPGVAPGFWTIRFGYISFRRPQILTSRWPIFLGTSKTDKGKARTHRLVIAQRASRGLGLYDRPFYFEKL